jgi:hypothetical protein
MKIEADILLKDCAGKDFDLIVLPGGMPVGIFYLYVC